MSLHLFMTLALLLVVVAPARQGVRAWGYRIGGIVEGVLIVLMVMLLSGRL